MSESTQPLVWINGQPDDRVPVSDRGLTYGDGLFETIRITATSPILLEYHVDRLMLGCSRLRISLERAEIESELQRFPGMSIPGVVKLMVTRGSGGRGYSPSGATEPRRILQHFPLVEHPETWATQGVQVLQCQHRMGHSPVLAGIKHLNRLDQVMARSEWEHNSLYQEGLVCDLNGSLIEGTMSNVFIVSGDRILTPRLDQCGVAGVMRRWLMEQFRAQGRDVIETTITLDGFRVADERFFCNSVFGVWPVAQFENSHWLPGPVTRLAQQFIRSAWF